MSSRLRLHRCSFRGATLGHLIPTRASLVPHSSVQKVLSTVLGPARKWIAIYRTGRQLPAVVCILGDHSIQLCDSTSSKAARAWQHHPADLSVTIQNTIKRFRSYYAELRTRATRPSLACKRDGILQEQRFASSETHTHSPHCENSYISDHAGLPVEPGHLFLWSSQC